VPDASEPALRELGVQTIPPYSPQARGAQLMERHLAEPLAAGVAAAGNSTLDGADRFLREQYIAEFNQKFSLKATERGTAFRRLRT